MIIWQRIERAKRIKINNKQINWPMWKSEYNIKKTHALFFAYHFCDARLYLHVIICMWIGMRKTYKQNSLLKYLLPLNSITNGGTSGEECLFPIIRWNFKVCALAMGAWKKKIQKYLNKLPPSEVIDPVSGMVNPAFRTFGGVGVLDASIGRSSESDDCERTSSASIGFTGFTSISSFEWESLCGRPDHTWGTNCIFWIILLSYHSVYFCFYCF